MGSRPTSPKKSFWIQEAPLIYKHFSGAENPKNRKGDRNFGLLLTPEMAATLAAADYNVKTRKAMDATDEYEARPEQHFIICKLGFQSKIEVPRVVMISCVTPESCKRTALTEEMVSLLDTANTVKADCKIGAYDWGDANDGGRTAYANSLFITVELDPVEAKYEDIPWSDDNLKDGMPIQPGDDANE